MKPCESCDGSGFAIVGWDQDAYENIEEWCRPCLGTGIDFQDRYWEKVRKTDGCWLWTAFTNKGGYGSFKMPGRRGSVIRAHRVSWMMTNGEVSDGLFVLHNCPGGDNPACVNPAHLWLGGHLENTRDMEAKGRARHPAGDASGRRKYPERWPKGEQHHNAVLTAPVVLEIKSRLRAGENRNQLAKEKGVSWTAVDRIAKGVTWAHAE